MRVPLHRSLLHLEYAGSRGRFRAELPAAAANAWCQLTVRLPVSEPWWAKLEANDSDRGQVVREVFLGPLHREGTKRQRGVLVHLPAASKGLVVQVFTNSGQIAGVPWAKLTVLPRPLAAMAILAQGWRLLPSIFSGGRMGLPGLARTMLGQAAARAGDVPPYSVWAELYDGWGQAERDALARSASQVSIAAVVVGGDPNLRAATLADLKAQWLQPDRIVCVLRPADFRAGRETWVWILQAGEQVAPHALACFAHAALRWPSAQGFYGDVDVMSCGSVGSPLFKPQPDPWLLGSGLITSGSCLLRTTAAADHTAARSADAWRLSTALSAGADSLRPIPFVLTHLPAPTRAFHNAHQPSFTAASPSVTIVVPSAAKSSHVLRCMNRLVSAIDSPDVEILVAVSNVDPVNAIQARIMKALSDLPRVRIVNLNIHPFNYAAANNAAMREAKGDLILLLNDDVVPIRKDWLQHMVSYIDAPAGQNADIVGARLLYGNQTVQHNGVIVGLANLCEHAFRLSPRRNPGPHGIALLDRQVSAVTGACMMLRRSLYETLGGFDVSFAIALNDVDLCLRAGAAGARIVLAAGVELYHYESISLGRHYESGRAALEAVEVNRLRLRWAGMIADDPFYHPRASLMPGYEFQPGFPPRCSPLSWINSELR